MKLMNMLIRRFYLFGAIIGIIYALAILNFSFITTQSAHWKNLFGDSVTYIIGSLYFSHDSWRWPLFYVPTLAFPEGTSIIYTDSIPLLALINKIIFKITGEWINYFGFWIFLCFPLLGLFTALATKECNFKNPKAIPLATISTVLLALSCPAFLMRFGHLALMGQFLIVWAFFLYLKFHRHWSFRNLTIQFAILTSLSLLLQTYFLLMIMPFYVAILLQAVKEQKIVWSKACVSFAIVIASIILMAFITGIIGSGSPYAAMSGFGYYSMNILSPFIPPRAHLPTFISQYLQWDVHGYLWDATGGQYEGYNYLGAGVLILLLVNILYLKELLKFAFKQHLFLCLGLIALCLLALSTKVYLGNILLIKIPMGEHLFSYFRTSGRMFWPVYYVLSIALVVATFNRFSLKKAAIIVFIAVLAQLMDTQILRHNMAKAERSIYPQALNHDVWRKLIAAHQFIEQYPSFQCGGWAGDWPANNSNMEMLLLAAKQNKPTNSAYLARTSRNCFDERIVGATVNFKPGGLYIFAKDFPLQEIRASKDFYKQCRAFEFGFVCSTQLATSPKLVPMPEFKVPQKLSIPTYKLGETLHFVTNGNGIPFLARGWYGPETWGTWTMDKDSEIKFKIRGPLDDDYLLNVYARGFVHQRQPIKKIDVYVNGTKIATWEYRQGDELKKYSVEIPAKLIREDGVFTIKFHSNEAVSPKDVIGSEDRRRISLGLVELSITNRENS